MIQLAASAFDPADLEEVRGRAPPPPIRAMNLQIALRRTTAGVALVSALALGSGVSLLLQPQAAQAAQSRTTKVSLRGEGDTCFFFAGRWWCP
jgi:hypothetical protein